MNKEKISQMLHKRVRLRPVARRVDASQTELSQLDDIWIVAKVTRDELALYNPRTEHTVPLGTDHVREYMTDAAGRTDGILVLKSQIFITVRGIFVEPII